MITELVARYKQGEISFEDVLTAVPGLEWGTRHEEVDGEIWWDGDNTVADVGVLFYQGILTWEEHRAIINQIP